jgi:hypothetical protein
MNPISSKKNFLKIKVLFQFSNTNFDRDISVLIYQSFNLLYKSLKFEE